MQSFKVHSKADQSQLNLTNDIKIRI